MKKETIFLVLGLLLVIGAAFIGAKYYGGGSVEPKPISKETNTRLVGTDSPSKGPADAPVTIVEFYDPECESCRAFNPVLKKVMKDYEGKVRLVARIMPLHPNSSLAGTFIKLAEEKGKYWEAQEFLYNKQSEWGTKHGPPGTPQPDALGLLKKYAVEFGLEEEAFTAALKENRYRKSFEKDFSDGKSLGVNQTPTLFVNGVRLSRLTESDLKYMIDLALKK